VLFLCGGTWKKVLAYELLLNTIIISIAFVSAVFFSMYVLENIVRSPFLVQAFVFSLAFISVVYATTTTAVLLILKKESVESLIRRD
jgi:formate/nitrite transporter FocA (FNT family)